MDGSLEDEDLVMISNPDFEQYKKLSPSYQKLIDNHSFESGELFSKIFPNAVKEKVLIENHHGPQFNKNFHDFIKAGDEGNDICLFSLSQNLAQEILTKNLDIMSLKKNIKRFEEDHPSEKAIKSLKKLA